MDQVAEGDLVIVTEHDFGKEPLLASVSRIMDDEPDDDLLDGIEVMLEIHGIGRFYTTLDKVELVYNADGNRWVAS